LAAAGRGGAAAAASLACTRTPCRARRERRARARRDRAQAVAKEEIAELERRGRRGGLDGEYLKAVLLGGFESGELPARSALLPVLGRLLAFSPAELARAAAGGRPAPPKLRRR